MEKYEFQPDQPTQVTLKFNQPRIGQGQFGTWYFYGATINGMEIGFFAPETLHQRIQFIGLKAGSTCTITKRARINQETNKPYVEYELLYNGNKVELFKNGVNQQVAAKQATVNQATAQAQEDEKWQKIRDEKRDDIKWMNALNNACLLIAHGQSDKSIQELANDIYRLEPSEDEVYIGEEPPFDFPN
jgi:hypothetical protein